MVPPPPTGAGCAAKWHFPLMHTGLAALLLLWEAVDRAEAKYFQYAKRCFKRVIVCIRAGPVISGTEVLATSRTVETVAQAVDLPRG